MKKSVIIGSLPKAFIATALINFLGGSVIGAMMACAPYLGHVLAGVHGELNPYGWLTMLIYGMTYAVLNLFTQIRLPHPLQGWIHVIVAELGVLVTVLGLFVYSTALFRVGVLLQALCPVIFLLNVISAVVVKRLFQNNESENESTLRSILLGERNHYRETDMVARRGTDVALMLFVGVSMWSVLVTYHHVGIWTGSILPFDSSLLVYEGWIGGTVLAVATHLHTRLFGEIRLSKRSAQIGQTFWGLGVTSTVLGLAFHCPLLMNLAPRLFGISFAWCSIGFLGGLKRVNKTWTASIPMMFQNRMAWKFAWSFAFIFSIALLLGLDPMSLIAIHLLFLGWITTLVYAIGYAMFPMFLGRDAQFSLVSVIQVVTSVIGTSLMVVGFYGANQTELLSFGGVLSTAAVFGFFGIQAKSLIRGRTTV